MKGPSDVAQIEPGVLLDGRGGLLLQEHATLVVADLHWGFSLAQRTRGGMFPHFGDQEIEERLNHMIERHHPSLLVWLGDSLHTLEGREAAEAWIDRCLAKGGPRVEVVRGNHDRGWLRATQSTLRIGNWLLHHGDQAPPVPEPCREIIGHHHPALHYSDGAGTRLHLPALILEPRRIILPALSPWAAGVPWNPQFGIPTRAWVATPKAVFEAPNHWLTSEEAVRGDGLPPG